MTLLHALRPFRITGPGPDPHLDRISREADRREAELEPIVRGMKRARRDNHFPQRIAAALFDQEAR